MNELRVLFTLLIGCGIVIAIPVVINSIKFARKDRATRTEFWAATAITLPLKLVFIVAAEMVQMQMSEKAITLAIELYLVAIILDFFWICYCVRRLHDIDHSGWWWLLYLIPIIGFFILLVWCGGTRSVEYENQWGKPKNKIRGENVSSS